MKPLNIPGYQLGRQIAARPCETLYNAIDTDTSKTVTVHVLNSELASNQQFCEQFKPITDILVGKRIGVMTPIKRAMTSDSGCYLITEYFPEPEQLKDSVTEIPPQQVFEIGQQLAATLSLIHSAGLVHGGIHLQAVSFPNASEVVLAPINLQHNVDIIRSKYPDQENRLLYQAPEVDDQASAVGDFYALGVVLYRLLVQKLPFNATTADELEQQKLQSPPVSMPSELEHLAPFFNQILDPDPNHRISNVEQYRQALKDCGTDLKPLHFDSDADAEPDADSQAGESENPEPGRSRFVPAVALVAGVAVVAILFILLTGGDEPDPAKQAVAPVQQPTESVQQSDFNEAAETREDAADSAQLTNQLYQQALDQFDSGKFGSALITVNDLLKQQPGHAEAQALKARLESELEASSIFARANQQIEALRLTRPPGDNALESYRELERLFPQGDPRIRVGYERIADYYVGTAEKIFASNRLEDALSELANGEKVLPDHPPLQQLKQRIQEQLLTQQQEKQRLQREQRLRAQQEQKRLQERKQRQQDLAARERASQQIAALHQTARRKLDTESLSIDGLNSAREDYRQLSASDDNASRLSRLRRDIIDAYALLAQQLKEQTNYSAALDAVEQGLAIDSTDSTLLATRSEINSLVAASQREEPPTSTDEPEEQPQSVTIIPTF